MIKQIMHILLSEFRCIVYQFLGLHGLWVELLSTPATIDIFKCNPGTNQIFKMSKCKIILIHLSFSLITCIAFNRLIIDQNRKPFCRHNQIEKLKSSLLNPHMFNPCFLGFSQFPVSISLNKTFKTVISFFYSRFYFRFFLKVFVYLGKQDNVFFVARSNIHLHGRVQ